MKFAIAGLGAVLGLALLSGAYADTREQAFKQLDIDGDGAVSKAEASGHAQLMNAFDRADKDHDGKLSRAEYDSIGKPEAKAAGGKAPEKAKTAKVKAKTPEVR